MIKITEKGEDLKESAISIPQSVAGCVKLNTDKAMQLYHLLYKVLGALKDK